MHSAAPLQVLGASDPDPVEVLRADMPSSVLLVCEHAGRNIPQSLNNLELDADIRNSHRGWDIGAEDVARGLSDRLEATLVLQHYSRLVIDSNRPPRSPESILQDCDGRAVPGNCDLPAPAREARINDIFDPLDRAMVTALATPRRACFSIHSFTPSLNGQDRPWHAGFLTRTAVSTAEALMGSIAKQRPDLILAINQPYQIDDDSDWFIPVHAEPRGLPHCLIEIRNDQLRDADGVAVWVDLLALAISDVMKDLP
ncbi:MAG: N-formylglutamate amidohydrolase [Paracoccaceae bacterium]